MFLFELFPREMQGSQPRMIFMSAHAGISNAVILALINSGAQCQPGCGEPDFRNDLRSAAINLADLYRRLRRAAEGENVLRASIAASPEDGGLHHAPGLALTRLKQPDAALTELGRAAELEPDRHDTSMSMRVGLHSAGRASDAIAVLKQNLTRQGNQGALTMGIEMVCRKRSDMVAAIGVALCTLLPLKAGAQNSPESRCWEVTAPAADVPQHFPILINKCTGKTWLLTKVNIREAKSGQPGVYAYRWRPIATEDSGEPTLSTLP